MSNLLNFNERLKIEDEASMWVAKIDRTLTPAEENEFKTWVTSNPIHYKTFMAMAECWDKSETFHRFYLKNSNQIPVEKKKASVRRYAVAASLFFVVLIAGLVYKVYSPQAIDDTYKVIYSQSFVTHKKSSEEIRLPDGTKIKLNAGSIATLEYTSKIRKLELAAGEVYVEVAHETDRPFVVATGDRFIRAIGTAFNVEIMESQDVALIVVDGRVVIGSVDEQRNYLSGNTQTTVIAFGQQAILSKGKDIILAMSKSEIEQALAWKKDALVFDGQTLEQVLIELNRYTEQRIELENQDLADVKITGYFKVNNIEAFFSAIENNFGIHHRLEKDNRVVLYR